MLSNIIAAHVVGSVVLDETKIEQNERKKIKIAAEWRDCSESCLTNVCNYFDACDGRRNQS